MRRPLPGRVAAGHPVRARPCAQSRREVRVPVGENQREALLECSYTVDAPAADDLIHRSVEPGQVPLAAAEGEVKNVADDEALGNVLRRQRALALEVVEVLDAASRGFQPVGK